MKAEHRTDCFDNVSSQAGAGFDCSSAITNSDRADMSTRCWSSAREQERGLVDCGVLPCLDLSERTSEELDCAPASDCAPVTDCAPVNDCPPVNDFPIVITPPVSDGTIPPPAPVWAQPELDEFEVTPPQANDGTSEFQELPPLAGSNERVELGYGEIPEVLRPYATIENGRLTIDARGDQIPALTITRDNVTIKNARIKNFDGPSISISEASNIVVEDSELSGGQRGVLADRSSNISVRNNWLHDFTWSEKYDTTAVEFDHVDGGVIEGNKITGLYKSDAISMFESRNLRASGNTLDITIDEWSSAPLMVEGNSSSGIEVSNNVINYPVGNNVPPGILGGRNHRAFNNLVNGDRSVGAWQMYAYNDVWQDIYFDGQKIA